MKFGLLILLIQFWLCTSCMAQKQSPVLKSDCPNYYDTALSMKVYTFVNKMPQFIGGDKEMLRFFTLHFNYPKDEAFIGRFPIESVIDEEGNIIRCSIRNKKPESIGPAEREAIRIFKSMPRWKPGKCNGKAVPVKISIAINI